MLNPEDITSIRNTNELNMDMDDANSDEERLQQVLETIGSDEELKPQQEQALLLLQDNIVEEMQNTFWPAELVVLAEPKVPPEIAEDVMVYEEWLRNLPSQLSLPDSDLLRAIHAYVSDFQSVLQRLPEYTRMDGTALLCLGVLLEEMVAEAVGETGHLAFLESEEIRNDENPTFWNGFREVPFHYGPNEHKVSRKRRKIQRAIEAAKSERPNFKVQTWLSEGNVATGNRPIFKRPPRKKLERKGDGKAIKKLKLLETGYDADAEP
jgi:hypothetical protein